MQNATILEHATEDRRNLFWSKVEIQGEDDCWTWRGAVTPIGYGVGGWRFDGRWNNWRAHRLAYLLTFGHFADELTIDHMCMNRVCVNPSHLDAIPARENQERATLTKITCSKGHALIGDNVIIVDKPSTPPYRQCVTCLRGWKRAAYDRLLASQGKTRVRPAA